MFFKNKNKSKGSTLIEALAVLTIFSIAALSFYKMYTQSVVLILESKRRLVAVELAKERMEQLRNVPYDSLVVGSKITEDEVMDVNNVKFRIITEINSIDNPMDNGGAGDTNTNDYKRVKIYVLWTKALDSGVSKTDAVGSDYANYRVELASTFIPPAGQEGGVDYGILSINAVNSKGEPINGASVSITCTGCDGGSNFSASETTDSNGNVTLSVPPSTNTEKYHITIEKSGYQTTKTYEKYNGGSQNYEPLNTHLIVQSRKRTVETFVVDEVFDFPLQVMDPYCTSITGNQTFNYTGGRIVGTNPATTPNTTLYALDTFFGNTAVTTTAGSADVRTDTNLDNTIDSSDKASMGIYELNVSDFEANNSNLTFWKMMPNDGIHRNKLALNGALSLTPCHFIAMDESVDSLEVIVTDSITNLPIENASIRVQNTTLGYVASEETDEFGRTYFPNDKNVPLVPSTYNVRISKSGCSTIDTTIDTSSGGLNSLPVGLSC